MKKYRVFVRGENFLFGAEGNKERVGFYTTVYVEAEGEEQAETEAIDLLRNDQRLNSCISDEETNPPLMFVEEIEELNSFDGLDLPRTGFSFFPDEREQIDTM